MPKRKLSAARVSNKDLLQEALNVIHALDNEQINAHQSTARIEAVREARQCLKAWTVELAEQEAREDLTKLSDAKLATEIAAEAKAEKAKLKLLVGKGSGPRA